MKLKLIFACTLFALVSCRSSDDSSDARQYRSLSADEVDSMVVISGQEYVETIGKQNEIGPYRDLGSSSGGAGWSARFENLTYTAPHDGREYIARRFMNSDGTAFMKISKMPQS